MTRQLRRFLRVAGGMLSAAAAAVAVGGLLHVEPGAMPRRMVIAIYTAVLVTVLLSLVRRFRFEEPSARAQRTSRLLAASRTFADIEIGLALTAGCYAVLSVSGASSSPLYPIVYGVVAFAATFLCWSAVGAVVLSALALEVGFWWHAETQSLWTLAIHALWIVGAAGLHAFFLRGVIRRYRQEHRRRLADELDKQRESALDYRLISAALAPDSRAPRTREDEELRLAVGAVESVRESLFHTLNLVKRSLGARTCILLWMDEQTEELKIKELVTDSEEISESARVGQGGVLGAVVRDRTLLCLPQTRPGQVPYYEGTHATGAFIGVPVMDGPHLRGVLCADRESHFDDRETSLLNKAAEHVHRIIRTERVFAAVERAKYEHERFYLASAMLCKALTMDQVMETAFDSALQIADYDVAMVALYDGARRRHRVYAVRKGENAQRILGEQDLKDFEFRDNSGLASMVVKNKHYLPAGGELRDSNTPIFTKRVTFKGAESLVVLPLLSADEAIGTLTLISHRKHRFRKDIREMLGVIANQVAISLQNAMMYKRMETMATTDGLTGLTNHRTFQERFETMLERAERHGHQAAVLLCDVDHFKSVNDTYGHPVGDEVLRQVAKVLRNAVRKIDIPARYGGEEFAVVLEATDEDGALQLANRIREDVAALELDSDKGTFQITMSIGVSTFPADAKDRALLIERADHALYHAKESGRNRVVSYQNFAAAKNARRAS